MVFRWFRDRRGGYPTLPTDGGGDGGGGGGGGEVPPPLVDQDTTQVLPSAMPTYTSLPDDVDPGLAEAWFHHRHQQQQQQQLQQDEVDDAQAMGGLHARVAQGPLHTHSIQELPIYEDIPTDVDNGDEWDLEGDDPLVFYTKQNRRNAYGYSGSAGESVTPSGSSGSSPSSNSELAHVAAVRAPQSSAVTASTTTTHRSTAAVADEPAMSSLASIISDQTPVMSNRDARYGKRYPRASQRRLPRDRKKKVKPAEMALGTPAPSCLSYYFDLGRWQGKVIVALLFLLLVSVVTLVVTLLLSTRSATTSPPNASNGTDPGNGGGTVDVSDMRNDTSTPTGAPISNIAVPTARTLAPGAAPMALIPSLTPVVSVPSSTVRPTSGNAQTTVIPQPGVTAAPVAETQITSAPLSPVPSPETLVDVSARPEGVVVGTRTPTTLVGMETNAPTSLVLLQTAMPSPTLSGMPNRPTIPGMMPAVIPALPLTPTQKPTLASSAPTLSPHPSAFPSSSPTRSLLGLDEAMVRTATLFPDAESSTNTNPMTSSYGSTLCLSADGRILAVGAPDAIVNGAVRAGRVQVYERTVTLEGANVWNPRGPALIGRTADDTSGSALALSADGTVLAIAHPLRSGSVGLRAGAVRVVRYNPETLSYDIALGQELQGAVAVSYFGASLALSPSGLHMVVGASFTSNPLSYQGQVRVFEYDVVSNRWLTKGRALDGIAAQDWFGSAVAIYDDEEREDLVVCASAPHASFNGGYVLAYQWDSSVNDWAQMGGGEMNNEEVLRSSGFVDDNYGTSISVAKTTSNTYRLAVGIPFKDDPATARESVGITVVYEYTTDGTGSGWTVLGDPIISNAAFEDAGKVVQLIDDGNLLIIGIPGSAERTGSIRLLRYDDETQSFMSNGGSSSEVLQGAARRENFGIALSATRRLNGKLVIAVGAVGFVEDPSVPGYVAILSER